MASPVVHTTTTNASTGLAVFRSSPEFKTLTQNIGILYSTTNSGVAHFTNEANITPHNLQSSTSLIPSSGSNLIIVEWPPGNTETVSTMHSTASLDLGVMIAGSVELVLDSGEKRLINAGEVLIHRGTKHGWRNPSLTETARMVFFVLPAEKSTE